MHPKKTSVVCCAWSWKTSVFLWFFCFLFCLFKSLVSYITVM